MVSSVGASSFTIRRFAEIDSTNDWLLAAARGGADDRTVVVADFQVAGRGRLDRTWEAPKGSALLCSVLLRVRVDAGDRHLAGVAVALSALDAIDQLCGLRAGLKWPNDLVVEDKKLGGVLAETDGTVDRDGNTALVVGIGVNLTTLGPPRADGTSLLAWTGIAPRSEELLGAMLDALDDRADDLATEVGRGRLLASYREQLVTIGRHVRVELANESFEGVVTRLDDECGLVVASGDTIRTVSAGDVVHLRQDSGPTGARE
jgi:BirA family transcriptional regulator, biotin operon repressor / biotin---[acetyl-CoA-carboxylase] ligase